MVKFLLIGPISKDHITKGNKVYNSIGGAVYYQSAVFSELGIENTVVTTLNYKDKYLLGNFPEDTEIIPIYTSRTLEFDNLYHDDDPNHRIQKARADENPIKPTEFKNVDLKSYSSILLSPLTSYDIPLETIQFLRKQDKPLYMGAQGYLRCIMNDKIFLRPWEEFKDYLKHLEYLFLDESEARVILNDHGNNLAETARKLETLGPQEVIITQGDRGAVVYSGKYDKVYDIPAKPPEKIVDPTGMGDTFMAAYAAKKLDTEDPLICASFAAQISSEKMAQKGAYKKRF
ncbi:MAG TPA: PfkB family carbohydrate kinase [Methanobacterium sp.]|nr:PfkB family carbohydrate kinase [Methanobacterium sp.]